MGSNRLLPESPLPRKQMTDDFILSSSLLKLITITIIFEAQVCPFMYIFCFLFFLSFFLCSVYLFIFLCIFVNLCSYVFLPTNMYFNIIIIIKLPQRPFFVFMKKIQEQLLFFFSPSTYVIFISITIIIIFLNVHFLSLCEEENPIPTNIFLSPMPNPTLLQLLFSMHTPATRVL